MYQTITEPTHFNEHSSSVKDVVFTNILYSGVAEHFLHQDIRYHCLINDICIFSKNVSKSFTRCIWKYDEDNYDLLRSIYLSIDEMAGAWSGPPSLVVQSYFPDMGGRHVNGCRQCYSACLMS